MASLPSIVSTKSHGKYNFVAKVLYFSAISVHFSETVSHLGDALERILCFLLGHLGKFSGHFRAGRGTS